MTGQLPPVWFIWEDNSSKTPWRWLAGTNKAAGREVGGGGGVVLVNELEKYTTNSAQQFVYIYIL